MMRWVPGLMLAAGAAWGCSKPWNEQIDLTGVPPLPALSDPTTDPLPPSGGRSVTSLDRTAWSEVLVQVPIRQVESYPPYTGFMRSTLADDGALAGGFPHEGEALDDRAGCAADVGGAFVEPFFAVGLLLWSPVSMVGGAWPWTMTLNPPETYERIPPERPPAIWEWVAGAPRRGASEVQWRDEPAAPR